MTDWPIIGDVTVPELAAITGVPEDTIRWHCRHPNGQLYGQARRTSSRAYVIPREAAERFRETYRRRPGGRRSTPPAGPSLPEA